MLKEHIEISHPEVTNAENGTSSAPCAISPSSNLVGPGGPYGCSQCTTSFPTKDQLEKHELLHSPNAQVVSLIVSFFYMLFVSATCILNTLITLRDIYVGISTDSTKS